MSAHTTLRDLGEREIIEQLLRPRYGGGTGPFGDDCASVQMGEAGWVVVTTDPCPRPMASLIGFSDYYYWGWLLSTINLSDLAAAGAEPIGVLTSLVLPTHTRVHDLDRLLSGIDACCAAARTQVIGGNLKEGPSLDLSGTALGRCDSRPMSRIGARAGDCVVVIGDLGNFWAGYLVVSRKVKVSSGDREFLMKNILTPVPKVAVGVELRRAGLLHACMDNSDGLYPSLLALGRASGLGVALNFSASTFQPAVMTVAQRIGVDPVRLALGWGDWQLIAAADVFDIPAIEDIGAALGVPVNVIGVFTEEREVTIERGGRAGRLMQLDSQRFASDSWFDVGIDPYVQRMFNDDLSK